MPRGGKRPGAGAPRGNLNSLPVLWRALKHGRRSAQGVYPERSRRTQLGALLATIPEARAALLALARRYQLKQRKAEEIATLLLSRMMRRAEDIAGERLNAQPPIHERRSIKRSARRPPSRQSDLHPENPTTPTNNQIPHTKSGGPSAAGYERNLD